MHTFLAKVYLLCRNLDSLTGHCARCSAGGGGGIEKAASSRRSSPPKMFCAPAVESSFGDLTQGNAKSLRRRCGVPAARSAPLLTAGHDFDGIYPELQRLTHLVSNGGNFAADPRGRRKEEERRDGPTIADSEE